MKRRNDKFAVALAIAILSFFGSMVLNENATAKTTSATFTENFTRVSYRDSKNTTAKWDIQENAGYLPTSEKLQSWEKSTGLPDFDAAVVGTDDRTWLVGGGASGSGGTRSKLYKFAAGSFSEIQTSFQFSITAIASNGSYWLFGVKSELYQYDGSSFTSLTSQLPPVFGSIREIQWNGGVWMITGSNNIAILYDGTTFTNLDAAGTLNTALAFANGVTVHAAWNDEWLFGGTDGRMFLFDGTSATQVTSPFSSGGQIYALASDGENWLIGGSIDDISVLYLYDGETFTKLDVLPGSRSRITNAAWSGDSWILTVNTSPSDSVYSLSQDGLSISQLSYGGSGWYVFTQNSIARTANGWLASGALVANSSSVSFVVQFPSSHQSNKWLQSKAVNDKPVRIKNVTVTATTDTPAKTRIHFFVSNNRGKSWSEAKVGKRVVFSAPGRYLLWRAVLTTKNPYATPSVKNVTLNYSYKE